MYKELKKIIKKASRVALFCHKNADIDAIGSALTMRSYLLKENKRVDMFLSEGIDDRFLFLKDSDKFKQIEDFKAEYDLYIAVDTANIDLLGDYSEIFKNFENTINIDHHQDNSYYAKYNLVNLESANCVNIYNILRSMKFVFDKDTASYIYAGLIGDTGNFCNLNTNANSFLIAYELMKLAIDVNGISHNLFRKTTLNKFVFTNTLKSNVKYIEDLRLAIIECTADEIKKMGASIDDLGAVISSPLAIDEVDMCMLISERDDGVKCSFRSKKDFNVNLVAKAFGGGGHIYACACKSENLTLGEFEKQIVEYIRKNYNNLKIV